jgi:hypothetical protein
MTNPVVLSRLRLNQKGLGQGSLAGRLGEPSRTFGACPHRPQLWRSRKGRRGDDSPALHRICELGCGARTPKRRPFGSSPNRMESSYCSWAILVAAIVTAVYERPCIRMEIRRPTKTQGETKTQPNIRNIIGRCFGGILTSGFMGSLPCAPYLRFQNRD